MSQNIVFKNMVYDKNIKTVQIYPQEQINYSPNFSLKPPVISLHENYPLTLAFDYLSNEFLDFRCKVVHCNANWTSSSLNEIEFLSEYNDFPIQDFKPSFATKIGYYHYSVSIPKTKVSGNFIVYVYRNKDENDSVLVKRFQVFENKMRIIQAKVLPSNDPIFRTNCQEVNFGINFAGHQILNPQKDLKVYIRQNFRDDKMVKLPEPFMVNNSSKIIEYQFFENENLFQGGNEFRMVDLRSTQIRLKNVAGIRQDEDITKVFVRKDDVYTRLTYVQSPDFDGMQAIDNYETHRGETEADYIEANFELNSQKMYDGKVFINGIFNDWQLNEKNEMFFDPISQNYKCQLLLKQGVYNYHFSFQKNDHSIDEHLIDNSYAQTQNTYEIFVFHQPIGARVQYLLGYQLLTPTN
ncbi:MAG: DUF5103 domain-containing protein [Pseudarcicella sp.]|nr:DUF5103 domain-containing protein [Pseudarcicella sp.]